MADSNIHNDPQAGKARPANRFFGRTALRTPQEALQPEAAPPPPHDSKKRPSQRRPTLSAISGFLSFLLFAAIGGVVMMAAAERKLSAPGPLATDTVVYIAPRTEVVDVVDQLASAGVIDSPTLMKASLWLERRWSQVKAGEYMFRRQASARDVMDVIVSGRQILHSVTIPEGLTSEQIVARLRESDVLAGEIRQVPPEGTLLPETYRVTRGMSRNDLIRKMQLDHNRLVDQIWAKRAPNLPLRSKFEMVTLASIVEKETGRADERTRVASVFHNRLNKRMRLQSDPTIVYGIVGGKGTLGRPILRSEITRPTAYNTYVIDGLPPGPIANPGRAALEAVANPSRTSDLFFVADGTGGHAFSETLDQHNRNVARWREIEREMRSRQESGAAPVDRSGPDEATPPATTPAQPANSRQRRGQAPRANGVYGALGPKTPAPRAYAGFGIAGKSAAPVPLVASSYRQAPIAARLLPTQADASQSNALQAIASQAPSGAAPLDASAFAPVPDLGGGGAAQAPSLRMVPVSSRRLSEMEASAARYHRDADD